MDGAGRKSRRDGPVRVKYRFATDARVAEVEELAQMPLPARWAIWGAGVACVVGGLVGLVVGLTTNPATAWFAVFELGLPAGIAGGFVGLVAALVVEAGRRVFR
jgi:hypothetical protein